MSGHGVADFLDRLTAEDDFRRDVGEALQGSEGVAAATVAVAREAGFEFTEEEFDRALDERYAKRELSDDELGDVSGGAVNVDLNSMVRYTTSSGTSVTFPDVCKTYSHPPTVPIPYSNIGMTDDADTTKSTSTTKPG